MPTPGGLLDAEVELLLIAVFCQGAVSALSRSVRERPDSLLPEVSLARPTLLFSPASSRLKFLNSFL